MESETCRIYRIGRMGSLQCRKSKYAYCKTVDEQRIIYIGETVGITFFKCCKLGFDVYGAGPELHGYTEWGSKTPELPSRELSHYGIFPSIWGVFRDANPEAEIGFFCQWGGLEYLAEMKAMSKEMHVKAEDDPSGKADKAVATQSCIYIKEKKPAFVGIFFDEPDHTGHKSGHDTEAYYQKLEELDGYIAEIVNAVKEAGMWDETIFIVTADHGGINKGHGGKTMQEMQTPFIIAGKGIKKGYNFTESMMQFDVASTIAYIFKLKQPQVWIGRPMKQVFK